jgi:MbtH protein
MDNDTATDGIEDAFLVVRNDEGQYSVWWQDRPVPAGWAAVGEPGSRQACLDRISELWTDLRPLSARIRLDAGAEPDAGAGVG